MQNKPLVNNQVKAKRVRLISEDGKQLGIIDLEKAIELAKSKGLDLIQVTEKVEPPVCKIADYGKYLYNLQKKERKQKKSNVSQLKEIRLTFGISEHDTNTRIKQTGDFIKEGYKVKITLFLRGREKALGNFAKEKIEKFLEKLNSLSPFKIERELKREPVGFTIIISKKQ